MHKNASHGIGSSAVISLTICNLPFSITANYNGSLSDHTTYQHSFFSKSSILPPYTEISKIYNAPLISITDNLVELQFILIILALFSKKYFGSTLTYGNVYFNIFPLILPINK